MWCGNKQKQWMHKTLQLGVRCTRANWLQKLRRVQDKRTLLKVRGADTQPHTPTPQHDAARTRAHATEPQPTAKLTAHARRAETEAPSL
jgi:hypothetical protein